MPRKVFTPQFKESAVRLASAPGAAVEDVAHELGVAAWTLRRWMKEQLGTSRKTPATPATPPAAVDPQARIRQLEREVRTLRMERDILKKATAFFAAEDQRQAKKEGPR
jgi:transposase